MVDKLTELPNGELSKQLFASMSPTVKCGCGIIVSETNPDTLHRLGWSDVRRGEGYCPGCTQLFKNHGL